MNDHDLDLLRPESLEQDAATQPISADLHQRSVSYGRRVVQRRRVAGVSATVAVVAAAALISVTIAAWQEHGSECAAGPDTEHDRGACCDAEQQRAEDVAVVVLPNSADGRHADRRIRGLVAARAERQRR